MNVDGTMENGTTGGGTDWSSLITLLASVVGGLGSGQSLFGSPSKQVSNVGPLTPEGQAIMDEYTRTMSALPRTKTITMGPVSTMVPDKGRMGILRNMTLLDAARRGALSQQPAEGGILAKLALALAAQKKKPASTAGQPNIDAYGRPIDTNTRNLDNLTNEDLLNIYDPTFEGER